MSEFFYIQLASKKLEIEFSCDRFRVEGLGLGLDLDLAMYIFMDERRSERGGEGTVGC